jgi:hypothetical protein
LATATAATADFLSAISGPGRTADNDVRLTSIPSYDDAISCYRALDPNVVQQPVVVRSGETLVLDGSDTATLPVSRLVSSDLDQFKAWIGIPDTDIRSGTCLPPRLLPGPYTRELEDRKETLAPAQWENLLLATNYYLFGDSSRVVEFRAAVERHLAPFKASLYVLEYLVVQAGGSLVIAGDPTALVVNTFDLELGGHVKVFSPVRVLVETLHRQTS